MNFEWLRKWQLTWNISFLSSHNTHNKNHFIFNHSQWISKSNAKKIRKLFKLHMKMFMSCMQIFFYLSQNLHNRIRLWSLWECGKSCETAPISLDVVCRYRLLINNGFHPENCWETFAFWLKPQASTACRYFNYSRCVINNFNIYNLPFAGKLNYLHTVLHSLEHLTLQIKFTELCSLSSLLPAIPHAWRPKTILLQNIFFRMCPYISAVFDVFSRT